MRVQGIPCAYITNKQGFWDFELFVDENVLIPRPDTEVLAEQALANIPTTEEVSF